MHTDPRTAHRRPRVWLVVSLAAAAMAIWLGQRSPAVEVRELMLLRYPDSGAHAGWIAEIALSDDGYPLLVHLDDDGWPALLYPQRSLTALGAQTTLRLPDPARGVIWSWPDPVHAHDLLAAATRRRGLDLEDLQDRLRREANRAPSAAEARARVREVLEKVVGPVRTAQFETEAPAEVAGRT